MVKRYRESLRSFIAFVKDRDIRSHTQDDLYAWANHRKDVEGVHASAINRKDLVGSEPRALATCGGEGRVPLVRLDR